ncbi:fibronectin type III domain-containing protein, partial [Streptomyces sp. MBT97]|uniref:carbohydrate binding domain-containing protein n=1 Tax=Streptomyces sp. MBT97 TaxID=2800411 RepID=UPI001909E2D6
MKRAPSTSAGRRSPRPLAAVLAIGGLVALLAAPSEAETATVPVRTAAAEANSATVFYYTKTKNWSATYLHWAPDGGAWTTVPGVRMESACTDWVKQTVDLGSAAGLQATFNNGSGTWDNNGGGNYALGTGTVTVKDGVIAHSDPCTGTGTGGGNQATVYYSTVTSGWTTANIHYAPTGGSWTTAPGLGMTTACTGWWKKTLDLGTATGLRAAFNNGNGVWDNNNGSDYTIPLGTTTVKDRTVTAGAADPCAAEAPDTQAPTAPAKVTANATGTSVVVGWDAATDNKGVTKYQVTRTGGTSGTVITDVGSTVLSDTGLDEKTPYTYTVKAVDAAGNTSPASAPAT